MLLWDEHIQSIVEVDQKKVITGIESVVTFCDSALVSGGGGDCFLTCRDLWRIFEYSFPASAFFVVDVVVAFFVFVLFCFEVEISSCILIPLF